MLLSCREQGTRVHWGFEANEEKHSLIPAKECRHRLEHSLHFPGKVKWLEPSERECLDSSSPAAPLPSRPVPSPPPTPTTSLSFSFQRINTFPQV